MAGKRPDQYDIDPGDSRATDHKSMPQVGRGTSSEDTTTRGDRQRLAESQQNGKEQPFLPDVPSPSAAANRAAKQDQLEGEEENDLDRQEDEP